MGLYVWIAVGAAVGFISRLLAIRYVASYWLEPILVGIAGAVVGGWIGARIRGTAGIDDMSWLAMVLAVIGSGVLDVFYYVTHRRQISVRRTRMETINDSERKAA